MGTRGAAHHQGSPYARSIASTSPRQTSSRAPRPLGWGAWSPSTVPSTGSRPSSGSNR